jgi:hypothetical protein
MRAAQQARGKHVPDLPADTKPGAATDYGDSSTASHSARPGPTTFTTTFTTTTFTSSAVTTTKSSTKSSTKSAAATAAAATAAATARRYRRAAS